ncbi:MAG: hypothetical protein JWM11_168 [Planctomycetaceae bacterium]|nr:hypothetical protein [Planctomycetaceae bacterium]
MVSAVGWKRAGRRDISLADFRQSEPEQEYAECYIEQNFEAWKT